MERLTISAKNLLSWAKYCFLGGIVLVHGLSACAPAMVVPALPFDHAQPLQAWRSDIEENVKRIKKIYPRHTDGYREAERRYIGLESKANAWIDRLRADLANEVELSRSERFENALEAVFQKYRAFMAYCDGVSVDDALSSTSGARTDRNALQETSRQIWQEYVRSDRERKAVIQAELKKLKWKDFEDI